MKKIFFLFVAVALIVLYSSLTFQKESFDQKRERILNELSQSIEDAEKEGKYKCCIDPPCTMCYLGDWIWKDGTCDCDGMIAKGEIDKVCPQCIRGIKEGRCLSKKLNTTCPVIIN